MVTSLNKKREISGKSPLSGGEMWGRQDVCLQAASRRRLCPALNRKLKTFENVKQPVSMRKDQPSTPGHKSPKRKSRARDSEYHLNPYPAYKPSGVKWLGDVPAHWEVRRIKTIFREADNRGGKGPLLSLTRKRGIVPQADIANRPASAENTSKYKQCSPGNIVMNRMQAWSGMFAVSNIDGHISPDYSIFVPVVPSISPPFFESLFRTPLLVGEFARRSKGIGDGFNRLYTPDFSAIKVVTPPLSEQTAIVEYLDKATADIEAAIARARRQVELLQEYRTRLIADVVTGRIDVRTGQPYPAYKPSGIEWLGDVPAHWEVRRLRELSRTPIKNGVGESAQAFRKDWPRYIRITDITDQRKLKKSGQASLPPEFMRVARVKDGDLLMATVGATYGKAYLHTDSELACFAGYLVRWCPSKEVISAWASYWTESKAYWDQIHSRVIKTTIENFSASRYRRLSLALPPLPEQTAIVEYLDKATAEIEAAIARARRRIELLQEYRTRLIADVVTGKLAVRESPPAASPSFR